ncbi:MAG: C-GCAxxG-C-C family protein [Thermoleophilia bacterium]
MATEKSEHAKAEALAGYLDPGPKHLNCAQAVMLSGLLTMDEDPSLTSFAGYLGGGMVRMGQVCGALSGAAVTLGMRDRLAAQEQLKNSAATFDALQQLFRGFESELGAVTCKELLGCDISSPEGFREAKRCHALSRCPEYVAWVCDRLNEILDGSRTASKSDRGLTT